LESLPTRKSEGDYNAVFESLCHLIVSENKLSSINKLRKVLTAKLKGLSSEAPIYQSKKYA